MESLSDFFDAYHPIPDEHFEATIQGANDVDTPPAFNVNLKLNVCHPFLGHVHALYIN